MAPADLLHAVARSMGRLEASDGSPMADRVHGLIDGAGHAFVESSHPRGVWQ
jgi:hypothetical protein